MFSKFHAAGNDFIIVDDRCGQYAHIGTSSIQKYCRRAMGIGADGIIFLRLSQKADFRMSIFNADGYEANMCGNGLRCLCGFIRHLKIEGNSFNIETKSGLYRCVFHENNQVKTFFPPPSRIQLRQKYTIFGQEKMFHLIDTGVFHAIHFTDAIQNDNFLPISKSIRRLDKFSPEGVNVSFVQALDSHLMLRTYEKGVEQETLACGTAAVAGSLIYFLTSKRSPPYKISFPSLESVTCDFSADEGMITNISLLGGYEHVFDGVFSKNIL